jgi:hypothetical protein
VHPLPAQVFSLVEAAGVVGATRARDRCDDLEQRALRRRPLGGQVEASPLSEVDVPEAKDAHRNSRCELAPPRRARHLQACERGAAHLGGERAPVELCQPDSAPPPAGGGDRQGEGERAVPPKPNSACPESSGERGEAEMRDSYRKSESEPGAEGSGDDVGGRDPSRRHANARREPTHSPTRGRSCSMRAGPIPGTASSSLTDEKAPFAAL